ncbi:MAG TPA: hypothetical protein VFS99_06510 [Xanthomonadaceae bacterium]|nr:hypothetical protein [Xanthomonadaceae bacterium]
MPPATDEDRLQHHLGALPEPPLPAALWPRVARARQRQLARRRIALGGGIAALFALLVLPGRLPGPDLLRHTDAAALVASAHTMPARAPVAADPDARLRILDRELQAAYHRGSGPAEIAQLWQARAALVRERDQGTRVRPLRI